MFRCEYDGWQVKFQEKLNMISNDTPFGVLHNNTCTFGKVSWLTMIKIYKPIKLYIKVYDKQPLSLFIAPPTEFVDRKQKLLSIDKLLREVIPSLKVYVPNLSLSTIPLEFKGAFVNCITLLLLLMFFYCSWNKKTLLLEEFTLLKTKCDQSF